jgi:hypothetical protein
MASARGRHQAPSSALALHLDDAVAHSGLQRSVVAFGLVGVAARELAHGFQVRVANTPQRLAAMRTLPPHQFVTRVVNGSPVYQYVDPLVCKCVYFGTQQNWDAYRREVFAQQLANEAQMAAIMNQQAWDFGPWGWGPFGP